MLPKHSLAIIAFAALASLSLSGCEERPMDAPTFYRLTTETPPAPLPETPIAPNTRAQVWRPGHWDCDTYNGGSFTWVPGEIINRPALFAVWAPDHWVAHSYGWAFEPGHWE